MLGTQRLQVKEHDARWRFCLYTGAAWAAHNVAELATAKNWSIWIYAALWLAFGWLADRAVLSFKTWLFAGTVINIVSDDDDGDDGDDEDAETAAPLMPPTHDEMRAAAGRTNPEWTQEQSAIIDRVMSGCQCETCQPAKGMN